MKNLLIKEIRLSASPLSFLFTLFAFMAFIPNYPILVGAFFISFGLFHSFRSARENGDILYSALLPVAKRDTVKSKFLFCVTVELQGFLLMVLAVLARTTVLRDAMVYQKNALMNANGVYLAFALLIFALFNLIFVVGFFKTAYYYTKPFVFFMVASFLTIGIAETLHHIPPLAGLNDSLCDNPGLQLGALGIGLILYTAVTFAAMNRAIRFFEKTDL